MERFYTDEQRQLRDTVRRYAEQAVMPAAAGIDRDDRFPRELYEGLAGLGLFGIGLPEAAGGSGLGTVSTCIAMEEIARASGTLGNAYALPVEAALFLDAHGSDHHKTFIPGILDGSVLPASAATEPDHGSDVAAM